MDNNELRDILNGYFGWNKARMACFVGMLISLFKVRTINLTELACGFSSNATIDSRYKRIKRFFKDFTIDFSLVASWVIQFFGLTDKQFYLSMERTNWQWGKKNINILMLSITYKGIHFVIRIKKNLLTTDSRGKEVHVEALFRGMKPTEERIIWGSRGLMGEEVYLSALKMPDGELLIVATDELSSFAIKKYRLRWEIETLFACLKSKGFNF